MTSINSRNGSAMTKYITARTFAGCSGEIWVICFRIIILRVGNIQYASMLLRFPYLMPVTHLSKCAKEKLENWHIIPAKARNPGG